AVSIHVLQGEREMASQNRTLGNFDLIGIPPAPRGVPQIEVTFDIDANGIVHVSAKDLGTGKEQKIRIESSSGLSEDDIEKMVKDAELHAEEDKREREKVEVRNEADSLYYSTEKSLKEYGDKISDEEKAKIEQAMSDLKGVMESDSVDQIKEKTEALQQAAYKLAEEMYKATAAEQAPEGDETSPKDDSDDNVEDADYEVVD
ncbi:MAG: Hsp70 family protein, partial [Spirochaetales bacterium]|nr:Hsp70 family protein [Spirochaetales bacterium]